MGTCIPESRLSTEIAPMNKNYAIVRIKGKKSTIGNIFLSIAAIRSILFTLILFTDVQLYTDH